MSQIILDTELPLPRFSRGKVRDTYDLGDCLLIVATDRISAFDFVLPCGIPDKGLVLNQISAFWFRRTASLMPNHLVQAVEQTSQLDACIPEKQRFAYPAYLAGRSMVVRKLKRIPVECVVRGYLAGSAWDEYRERGTICGLPQPHGLKLSQELPQVIFTPTTKADAGHDQPLTVAELKKQVGEALAGQLEQASLSIYRAAREYALSRGIIIADTKMEFGLDGDRLVLIDELLTPDSSRFWDARLYRVGQSQPSYDKQPVRDWLLQSGWDRQPPVPVLPPDVIQATAERYRKAFEVLTGSKLKTA